MVDVIVRFTMVVVLALAALNALHAGVVLMRLVRHLARRQPHFGLDLWVPAFAGPADIRAWLGAWRAALGGHDPAVVALRAAARTVIDRHVHLTVMSYTWAIAVSMLVPHLA